MLTKKTKYESNIISVKQEKKLKKKKSHAADLNIPEPSVIEDLQPEAEQISVNLSAIEDMQPEESPSVEEEFMIKLQDIESSKDDIVLQAFSSGDNYFSANMELAKNFFNCKTIIDLIDLQENFIKNNIKASVNRFVKNLDCYIEYNQKIEGILTKKLEILDGHN